MNNRMSRTLLTILVAGVMVVAGALALYAVPASAAGTVTDCTTYDGGAGSLKQALGGGGTITFACSGTIIVPTIVINANTPTVIDATGQNVTLSGDNANRVFVVPNGKSLTLNHIRVISGTTTSDGGGALVDPGGTLTVQNSTFEGNSATAAADGGAIASYGTLSISDSTLTGNSADDGAAVWNSGGTVTITGSTLSSNTATRAAGAVFNIQSGTVTISDSTVISNTAVSEGGAIYSTGDLTIQGSTLQGNSSSANLGGGLVSFGTLSVSDSTITGNSASDVGGGIAIAASGTANLLNATVTTNTAGGNGGGIYSQGGLTVQGGTINGNTAATNGGGIYSEGGLTVQGGTINGNSTAANGGGIFITGGTATLDDTTVTANSAGGGSAGGGIFNQATLTIDSSTVSANTANIGGGVANLGTLTVAGSTISANTSSASGGGIYSQATLTLHSVTVAENHSAAAGGGIRQNGGTVTLDNTIVANNSATGSEPDLSGTITSNDYNLIGDTSGATFTPQAHDITGVDPLLGPLQDNGGPTWTHALLTGSPAIDAGMTDLAVDQRGEPRPFGPADDIGAFELQANPQPGPDYVVNDSGDTDDGSCDLAPGTCTLREAINAANAHSGADSITFDIPATDAGCTAENTCTITLTSALATIEEAVTIDGAPNNGHITIDANGNRTFWANAAGEDFHFNALEIKNGSAFLTSAGIEVTAGNVLVSNSTFVHNTAASGGHIKNGEGTVVVVNSTFFDAPTTGIGNVGAGSITIYNSTIDGNGQDATGVNANLGTITLYNTIVTNQGINDCYATNGTVIADGYNIDEDGTCGDATSKTYGELALFALADNGGPTRTMALGAGSAAIDAGDDAVCAAAPVNNLDQRGVTRPQGAHCDVGAYEREPVATYTLAVTKDGTGSGTVTSTPAGIDCGSACSADFVAGTVVTLTAMADAGSTFTGWSGACTGTGDCVLTMDAAKSVTATFTLIGQKHYIYLPLISKNLAP